MELLLNTQEERCRMEVYNEYLKKIPQLLQQLETVETMLTGRILSADRLLETRADRPFTREELAALFAALLLDHT